MRQRGGVAQLLLAITGVMSCDVTAAGAQVSCPGRSVTAQLFTGSAWNVPVPLVIDLPAGRTRSRARFSTRPFDDAPYYSYRVAHRTTRGGGLEAEMLHHKLYLDRPVPPIERLEVTHGYNLPMLNAVRPGRRWQLRLGVGLVVAHPEGRIGGRDIVEMPTLLGGGYQIAGLTTQLSVGRSYPLASGRVAATAAPEAKLTASWARVRIPDGRLLVPNVALHLLGGVGVRRCE